MEKLQKSVICGTREQCTDALFTVDKSTIVGWTKKKKVADYKMQTPF